VVSYHHKSCEFELRSWRGVLNTTLCVQVHQWLAAGLWISPGTPVFSTNKTDHNDIAKPLFSYLRFFYFCGVHLATDSDRIQNVHGTDWILSEILLLYHHRHDNPIYISNNTTSCDKVCHWLAVVLGTRYCGFPPSIKPSAPMWLIYS
jgi:hypothetical protein